MEMQEKYTYFMSHFFWATYSPPPIGSPCLIVIDLSITQVILFNSLTQTWANQSNLKSSSELPRCHIFIKDVSEQHAVTLVIWTEAFIQPARS